MICVNFESEFFSGQHLRWNLGWPTPNHAGAFVVTLLPFLWLLAASRWRWALLLVEAGGLFVLAKTYSRGAVVAWVAAWTLALLVSRGWKESNSGALWLARLGLLGVALWGVAFGWSRQVAGAAEDGSVVNRLSIWRAATEMMAASPWTGWDAGESGWTYMNWFQVVEAEESYNTMVNGWLTLGVERGAPALTLAVFALLLLSVSGGRAARKEGEKGESPRLPLAMCCGASLVSWAVANVFSTLWIDARLWVVPGFALTGLVVAVGRTRTWPDWRTGAVGLLGAAGGVVALVGGGVVLQQQREWLTRPGEQPGWVTLERRERRVPAGEIWQVWPDRAVLGETPGKEIQRWAAEQHDATRIEVAIGWGAEPLPVEGRVLLFGLQAGRLDASGWSRSASVLVVHPLGTPPRRSMQSRTGIVVLPEIDQAGNGAAWRTWAERSGLVVAVTPGSGTDIRAAWPAVATAWRSAQP